MSSSSTSLKLAVTAGAVTNLAGAAIISADFSSSPISITNDGSSIIYVDFETASASLSDISDYDGALLFNTSNSELPMLYGVGAFWRIAGSDLYNPSKLSFGDVIGTSSGANGGFLEVNDSGVWNSPSDGLGYLGFNNTDTGSQAWLYIDYDDAANTITLLGMGYNDSGTLTAGEASPIPEPAAATALAALLAGGVAAFQRRRRAA